MGQKQCKVNVTDSDKAMLKLKSTRDELHQYKHRMVYSQLVCVSLAKELLKNGKKNAAILAINKKRMQQVAYDKADGMLLNVEQLIISLDSQNMNQEVFKAMKEGNLALKTLNSLMSTDDVEDLLADTQDEIAKVNKVNNALNQFSILSPKDEETIKNEFKLLLPSVPTHLPSVPTHLPSVPTHLPSVPTLQSVPTIETMQVIL